MPFLALLFKVILGCESAGVILEQPHPQYLSTAAKSKGLGTRHYPAAKGGRVIAASEI